MAATTAPPPTEPFPFWPIAAVLAPFAAWSLYVLAAWFGDPPGIAAAAVLAVALVPATIFARRRLWRAGAFVLMLPTIGVASLVVGGAFDGNPCAWADTRGADTYEGITRAFPPGADCHVTWPDGHVTVYRDPPDGFLSVLAGGLAYAWVLLGHGRVALRAAVAVVAPVAVLFVLFW